nr:unnamed protein product [Callosobruchus chinensis]
MYGLYIEMCRESNQTPVKESYYRHIFNSEFNLRFHYPRSDTCNTCNAIQHIIASNAAGTSSSNTIAELELHQQQAKHAVSAKQFDVDQSKLVEDTVVICFDLQKTLPTPLLTTNKCDRDFVLIEKKRKINPQVFVPEHWINIIKRSSKKFEAYTMEASNFVSLGFIKDPKHDSEGVPLGWRTIKWFFYSKDEAYLFKFKKTLPDEYPFTYSEKCFNKKGRPALNVPVPPLYSRPRTIKYAKWENLQQLLDFIPPIHHDFYKNRPHTEAPQKKNPVNMKKLLRVTFRVLEETSNENHPREYLTEFKSLEIGNYPLFTDYPKNIVDLQLEEKRRIDDELETVVMSRLELALEEKCLEKLRSKKELVEREREKVEKIKQLLPMYQLRKSFDQSKERSVPQLHNFSEVQEIFRNRHSKQESSIYKQTMVPSTTERKFQEFLEAKEQYLSRLKKLLEYKFKINEILDGHRRPVSKEERDAMVEGQIRKIRNNLKSTGSVKKLNINEEFGERDKGLGKGGCQFVAAGFKGLQNTASPTHGKLGLYV